MHSALCSMNMCVHFSNQIYLFLWELQRLGLHDMRKSRHVLY